jgi:Protein of unknown function (DUF3833)
MNLFQSQRRSGRALLLSAALSLTLLAGCASPQVSDYAAEQPRLDLRQYFNGTLDAYGLFTDRSGKVVKRFTVVMKCRWDGPPGQETGVLDEDFTYSDGSKQRRVWTLKRTADGRYTGTADDVLGVAAGEEKGNAFRWGYTLKLPVDGKRDAGPPQGANAPSGGSAVSEATSVGAPKFIEVQFDDWMYLMTGQVMLNKAQMSKFGVKLGEVTLSFVKR